MLPLLEKRLPEYSVLRLRKNGASVMVACPRVTSALVAVRTTTDVFHSSVPLIEKIPIDSKPVVPI